MRINLESCDHVTPIIGCECKLPYFLYKTSGEKVLCSMEGLSKILHLVPVATKKNLSSGLKEIAVTASLKLKCAMITFFSMLMISANPSTSMLIRMEPSWLRTSFAMFDLFWKGYVRAMLVVRLNVLILLPTALRRIWSFLSAFTSEDSCVNSKLPPV